MSDEKNDIEVLIEEVPPVNNSQVDEIVDELERDFNEFANSKSENNPDFVEKQKNNPEEDIFETEVSDADSFKLKIFLSLMFALLDGFHVFIYGMISKYKITKEDIALEEGDREGLEIYFRTQRVMDMINRLPVELIGFIHMEYLYFNKFQDFTKKMRELEEAQTEDVEDLEEEEEEEAEEKKPAKKRAVKKRKPKPKKKAVKKAAAVPEVKPEDKKE